MDLFDIVVAKSLAGSGGGGGGDSDFSTATVTVVNANESYKDIDIIGAFCIEENAMGEGSPAMTYPPFRTSEPETLVLTVAIYKGGGWVAISSEYIPVSISVSGNATVMGNAVFVTGNCAVTIS